MRVKYFYTIRKILWHILWIITLTNVAQAQQNTGSGRLDILRDTAEKGFQKADIVKPFNFPIDHGPHPGYRHEWWYATGNLDGPSGRRFGYQLTFFRLALAPEKNTAENRQRSHWKTPLAFAAHFAVTDVQNNDFHFSHRYSRGDGRLAGAKGTPVRVWLEDWSFEQSEGDWKIKVHDGDINLNLDLKPTKPPIFNGQEGLSRKSSAPGNATYYYSLPRLESRGTLEIKGQPYKVEGLTWLDREWGTSALANDQQGWDWYALHLSDGSDLMFYNLRKMDGSKHEFSAGTWVAPDGKTTAISAEDITIDVTDYWQSPLGGRYPSGWQLSWPEQKIELTIKPVIDDQELDTLPRYWEGAVDVSGNRSGNRLTGRGYVEMTGYTQ